MIGAINSRFKSNAQLDAQERADAQLLAAQEPAPVLIGLASHVQRCWQEAKSAKDYIIPRLLSAQLARAGKYSSSQLAAIKEFGGSEEYARITSNKCRVAEAWIRDVFIGQTEKPWTLAPTPKPDLTEDSMLNVRQQIAQEFATMFAATGLSPPPAAMQERTSQLTQAEQERVTEVARVATANMERTMQDQLVQGGWTASMGEFISDMVTYPAAHFRGPVLRKAKQLKWGSSNGIWAPIAEDAVAPEFDRMDPFRCFPSPGATSPQDGFFIYTPSLTRGDLYAMIGVEGFDEKAIREVLEEHGRGGLTDWTNRYAQDAQAIANGEQVKTSGSANVTIDAIEYLGPVQGRQLVEWGMSPAEVKDPDEEYEACVWMIGRWVIKAQLNYDPLGRRNIYRRSYEELPGAYWGFGLVDILEDLQGIANAGLRALVNNMAFGSGPQVGINVDRLPPGEEITKMHPLKIWQFNESAVNSNTKAIEFFQPETKSAELLAVIEKAYQFADDFSLIPRWMASGSGSERTASGMSMKMDAANKGLKGVVSNIDMFMSQMLEALFNYNMLFNPDKSIKGDAKVVARGAVSLMQLESLQLRRNEVLIATNNPTDNQIMGLEGRAEILRETFKGLQMDVNRVVPPRGSLTQQAPAGAPGEQPPAQPVGSGQELLNGAAVTDSFSKNSMTPQ